jgi:signal transduction histidine kinase
MRAAAAGPRSGAREAVVCFVKVQRPGLTCRVGTQWFSFGEKAGLPPGDAFMSFVLDASGYLYAGSRTTGLYRSTVPISAATLDTLPAKQIEAGVVKIITQPVFVPVLDDVGEPLDKEGGINKLLLVSERVWVGFTNGNMRILEGSPPRVVARIDSTKLSGMAQLPPAGAVWIGTEEGLFEIDPVSRKIKRKVTEQNGLLDNESSGPSAVAVGIDGTVYQGSAAGLTVYRPSLDRSNAIAPHIALRRFSYSENRAGNNELELNYAALSFANEKQIHYQTRLLGYDDDWSPPTTNTSTRYTNLSAFAFPKTYTFEVKAANNDGVWTESPLKQDVRVWPAWWVRWWALLFYGALFVGCAFAADRFQRRRLVHREQEKARERELEQAKEIEKAYHELERSHTQLKLAKDQLVQQEKLASLGQLTAGIAHEIKNPLNFVNNFSEVSIELLEEVKNEINAKMSPSSKGNPLEEGGNDSKNRDQEDDRSYILSILNDIEVNLGKIHEHGSRADRIIKSMLQHSRGGSGEMKPTDVNAVIREYVNLAFHGMRAGKNSINVDIELALDENVGKVPLVGEDFSRVILNLCNNTFDAMREKLDASGRPQDAEDYEPKLTVKTIDGNDQVIVEITDNGPGIPEEIKVKIMQPFFTTKKGTEGTGLGLYITNDIVKAHGGTIDIKSTEGKRTTFKIHLPRQMNLS